MPTHIKKDHRRLQTVVHDDDRREIMECIAKMRRMRRARDANADLRDDERVRIASSSEGTET